MRTLEECDAIEAHGDELAVFELQGPLYFGDAEQLVRRVLDAPDAASTIVLDGRRVTRVDSPAVRLIADLADAVFDTGRSLALAGFRSRAPGSDALDIDGIAFTDVDDAIEWWEDSVLVRSRIRANGSALPLERQELFRGVDDLQLAAVEAAVRIEDVPEATVLAREGDPSDSVFFLLSGQVSVRLGVHGDQTRRLAAFGAGAAVGEMALLDDSVRSANLVTDEPTRVAVLDVATLDALELRYPGLKATIYANLAQSLSSRLRRANAQIRALEE